MRSSYLEVTFRHGRALTAYLYLPRSPGDRSDHVEQAGKEGECQWLEPGEIGPSLAELVADPGRYETARERLTVFDSTGWALEDHVVVEMLLEHAEALGVGTDLPVEYIPEDPLDPYALGAERNGSGGVRRART